MKSFLIRLAILTAWLATVTWLVRFEAYPELFTHSAQGYQTLIGKDDLVMNSWMKILSRSQPIGYIHVTRDVDESDPVKHFILGSEAYIRVQIMGKPQAITIESSSMLDAMYNLQIFNITLTSEIFSAKVYGRRKKDKSFDVVVKAADEVIKTRVEIPGNAVLYSPFSELSLLKLKPGQEISVSIMDPLAMKKVVLAIAAEISEDIQISGRTVSAVRLSMNYRGKKLRTWIDEGGSVLKQETPLGWVIEKCTREEAFAAVEQPAAQEDILSILAGQFISGQLQ